MASAHNMVNVFLKMREEYVLALIIPLSDITRLSLRPVKWLRFVAFAISGARGDLSDDPHRLSIDYDITATDIAPAYYYTPDGDYHLVDLHGLGDRITSSELTTCASDFRRNAMARDGPACVVTADGAEVCDAAHLIPKSKGDDYISHVLHDRIHLYDPAVESENLGINSVENGLLLRKDLHALVGLGKCAFLETPNFALNPADIPRVEVDQMPASRITFHRFQPTTTRAPTPQYDVRFAGTGTSPPSTIVLDYIYGVAVYQHWGYGAAMGEAMEDRFTKFYKSIPKPPTPLPSDDDDDSPGPDDPKDGDYLPATAVNQRNYRLEGSNARLRAMDDILMLSMLIKGKTPESIADERQKLEEAEELRMKEASKVKVQRWMQNSLDVDFQSDASVVNAETDE